MEEVWMAPFSSSRNSAHTKCSSFVKPGTKVVPFNGQQLLLPFFQNSSTHSRRRRTFIHNCGETMLAKKIPQQPHTTKLVWICPPALVQSASKPFFLRCNINHLSKRRIVKASMAATAESQGATQSIEKEEEQEQEQEQEQKGARGKQQRKGKGSAQLARWARARRIRSGMRYSSDVVNGSQHGAAVSEQQQTESSGLMSEYESDGGLEYDDDGGTVRAGEKAAFMVSDGTGWTVDHSVHAALGQFEHCLVDRGCSVNTHLFSEVDEVERLMEIIRQAGEEEAIVIFTLADPAMAEAAREACDMVGVPHLDILGPITLALGNHLRVSPSGLPRGAPGRKKVLSKEYFKRIEAVEFTIKQDDGAMPKNLHLADLILVGVSRTSKTPLSTYMAQMGYKVANVPLVLGIDPPKQLLQVDQDKIYGLTINPNFLKSIRLTRYRHLGVADDSKSCYFDTDCIRKELEYSSNLFKQNPRWPVIEVTGKAIEESAAAILRIYHERKNKNAMPRISKRY